MLILINTVLWGLTLNMENENEWQPVNGSDSCAQGVWSQWERAGGNKSCGCSIPAVGQAKQHLLVPRLSQGHLNVDLKRLFYYYKIFHYIFSLPALVSAIISVSYERQKHLCLGAEITASSSTIVKFVYFLSLGGQHLGFFPQNSSCISVGSIVLHFLLKFQ